MIEVKYDDVGLTAVDTRMRPKVLADQWPVLRAIPLDPRDLLANVGLTTADVVLAAVSRVTSTTARLARPLRPVMKGEFVDCLEPPTLVAPLQFGEDGAGVTTTKDL